jgi:hypothetical protein
MFVPITVRCECGQTHQANLGETVTCGCGRAFDTSKLPTGKLGGVFRSQLRMRLYTTVGAIFVAGITVVAASFYGVRGLAVGLPVSGLIWFRIVGPSFRRRVFRGAGELPRWKLEATEVAEE